MMVMVVMVPVGELDAAIGRPCALLLIQRFQPRARIRDRLEQFGIGAAGEHVVRGWRRRGLRGANGSERGHRSQKSGHLLFQSVVSRRYCPSDKPPLRAMVPAEPDPCSAKADACVPRATRLFSDSECQRADLVIARSGATKQSRVSGAALDCFAEPVIGRAFARPVGADPLARNDSRRSFAFPRRVCVRVMRLAARMQARGRRECRVQAAPIASCAKVGST
jgi:hypothetical protein